MNNFLIIMVCTSFVLSADDTLKQRPHSLSNITKHQILERNLEANHIERGVTIAEPFYNDGLDVCFVPAIALAHNLVYLCFCKPKQMHESIDSAQNCWTNFRNDLITESHRQMNVHY